MHCLLSAQKVKGAPSPAECATLPSLDHLQLSDFDQ
jgi:hypothetical protein